MPQETFEFAQNAETTPMMKQYLTIKSSYKDIILFYRMGDFYEMFFEDAVIAAKILNIALTKRGKHESTDIPMCGVPHHSSENYLHKLIESGHKVAICEQMESPEEAKKRGYKAVVRREVVRVVTPGTIMEDNLLEAKSANYLMSLTYCENEFALSWVDISTGEFSVTSTSILSLSSDIARLSPKEILLSDKLNQHDELTKILSDWKNILTPHVASFFDYFRAENKIKAFYNVATIESFGTLSKAQISAIGSILEYISITQKANLPGLNIPKIIAKNYFMTIDPASRRNLELTISTSGKRENTVLSQIDKTRTNMGGRLLNNYLSSPLIDIFAIDKRLDLVEYFYQNADLIKLISEHLKTISDIERAMARLSAGQGGPRDLNAVKFSLLNMRIIAELIEYSGIEIKNQIRSLILAFGGFDDLIDELAMAVKEEAPFHVKDGGFINQGYSPRLDDLYLSKTNGKVRIHELKNKYSQITGVQNLKITQNNVLGFFIEVTPQHSAKMSADIFTHRQSLANAVRFSTLELKELENEIVNSSDLIMRLEIDIFEALREKILEKNATIMLAAHNIAILDVAASLAEQALENNYTRPVLDESSDFEIIKARHPVVENYLKRENLGDFMPNDCLLKEQQKIWLLTGPNMAGKSTFLRQNAILAILAQIGSFIPAERARIGIVDRVFSRVGAADDLARGRSTFMVEMVETAVILNQATSKSFIILDEIGRGTSTYDGVSIAWSCLEYIHSKIGARTLFATHYHELTNLEQDLPNLKCFTASVKEWDGKVIFLHKIEEGKADRSYGIHVAKLAGVPDSVVLRANQILQIFESKESKTLEIPAAPVIEQNQEKSKLEKYLEEINVNNISPIEALNFLHKIKELV